MSNRVGPEGGGAGVEDAVTQAGSPIQLDPIRPENPTSTNMASEENSGDVKPVLPFNTEELREYRENKSNFEKITIEYETDGEGFSGLGISITDVDVGYGPEKRWIFVTALTDGGAAQRDGRYHELTTTVSIVASDEVH